MTIGNTMNAEDYRHLAAEEAALAKAAVSNASRAQHCAMAAYYTRVAEAKERFAPKPLSQAQPQVGFRGAAEVCQQANSADSLANDQQRTSMVSSRAVFHHSGTPIRRRFSAMRSTAS
jgi:hypothetical protein